MNNRIIRTGDGRIYRCADCPYRNRETGFCGFCMKKVVDDMVALNKQKQEEEAHAEK